MPHAALTVSRPSPLHPQAMDLEVPVLARNIPGNSAVVRHGVTGLLFSDPQVMGAPPQVVRVGLFITDFILVSHFLPHPQVRINCHPS